jgi:hypothetical protein
MKQIVKFLSALALAMPLTMPLNAYADDAEMIKSAESAAPAAISSKATIYSMDATGKMATLREGSNGFWCMPDTPSTPGPDPCAATPIPWNGRWPGWAKKIRRREKLG